MSGGSDSLALLTLLIDWRDAGGPAVRAVTVDHGLRAESAAEAEAVARFCAAHAVAHTTLHWQDRDGRGNLPDRARRARYDLIAKWARETGIGCVALGHTIDDLAETFLMRLARAAGVDGLAAMAGRWCQDGVSFVRPALGISREELRGLLRARGIGWADDPGNEDLTYERVRARRALVALAPLGIDAQTLAAVAANLSDVRDALDTQLAEAAARIARVEAGDLVIDRDGLTALPPRDRASDASRGADVGRRRGVSAARRRAGARAGGRARRAQPDLAGLPADRAARYAAHHPRGTRGAGASRRARRGLGRPLAAYRTLGRRRDGGGAGCGGARTLPRVAPVGPAGGVAAGVSGRLARVRTGVGAARRAGKRLAGRASAAPAPRLSRIAEALNGRGSSLFKTGHPCVRASRRPSLKENILG
ncbi:MAG: tRNA lysidine(34) synthetase TilS [Roseovarius sp.]|nr:tRNA lysidine(34) synthetase TilS [Roseovarius sp.]